ncbi:erythrocyte membrane protein 1, PfEMP1, putative [Plasmodium sp. gorilla clade G2]|uniref:erythrocyte membrane protein 1, PfEMP1, putative n=1 Tax=Plasmodium sp. gorilla clade G2 TaxID=880535 RepID=UPI000D2B6FD0|nr:erythrocyte membrane protein 1, PfEMP1, putative [Plasmodium sp. gorilla clade G2]SOV20426.1 erythrocyte membrane protein 1, PfEMP1, putative [Plasmodium sp. gorilla clade G2]
MGNELSARQEDVKDKYGKDLNDIGKWYHGHYIEFLQKEILNTTWRNDKYKNHIQDKYGKPIVDVNKRFCKWKEIQREIFDAVMENHNHVFYTWEEKAKVLIDEALEKNNISPNCDEKDDKKGQKIVDKVEKRGERELEPCNLKHFDLKGCVPRRRTKINLKNVYDTFNNLEKHLQGFQQELKAAIISGAIATSLGTLATNEISRLHNVHKYNPTLLCKIINRNVADYKDIFYGRDIFRNDISDALQCKLNNIRPYLDTNGKNVNGVEKWWNDTLKKPIDNYLKELDIKGGIDGSQCTIDSSYENAQCARFFREWFEEFINLKKVYESRIRETCIYGNTRNQKTIGGTTTLLNCTSYCNGYNDFLRKQKICYDTYINNCKNKKSKDGGNDNVIFTDFKFEEKQIKKKFKCNDNDCGTSENVNLDAFFNVETSSIHKIYSCGCLKDEKKKELIFNNNEANISKLETVLNELGFCALTDDALDGTVGGNGDKIMTKKGDVKDICGINFYDSFIRKNTINPCKNNTIEGKAWICDGKSRSVGTILTEWKDKACLSPRTQTLCLGYLHVDNNGTTYNKIDSIDSNEKLLTELVYAAKIEGQNLKNYFASRHDAHREHNLCNALKYSFADLGDIVKGTSIWENGYTKLMETNLKAIFQRIYDKLPSEKQSIYKNDKNNPRDTSYRYLREAWWNTNREYIWKALVCGAGMYGNRCGGAVPANIDYMPQFLRWLTEWSRDFCEEKKEYDEDTNKGLKSKYVYSMCKGCDSTTGNECSKSYPSSGHSSSNVTCSKCKITCIEYNSWIENKKKEYEQQREKYDLEIQKATTNKKHNMLYNSKNITDFFKKMEKDYPKANQFLQEQLKVSGCDKNLDEIKFTDEKSTFNLKHKYCRSCNEQKHLEDAIGVKFLPGGLPGQPPFRRVPTGTTVIPPNTTGSQNISVSTIPGISVGEFEEQKPKHECDDIFNGNWNEWDCNQTDKEGKSVCRKKNNTDYDKEFFSLFNEWIQEFLNEHKKIEENVKKCTNSKGGDPSNCPDEKCRNQCYCYNKWANNKQKEWNSQKEFFQRNNIGSYGGLSLGDIGLDLYLDTSGMFDELVIDENVTPSSQIQQKISDAINKSEECVEKCPKPIKCEDKGFDNNWQCDHPPSSLGNRKNSMCLRKGDDKYKKENLDKLQLTYKFYDVFNEWLNDMQHMLEDNMEILKSSCTNKFISIQKNKKNNNNNMCNICRDDCKCYDDLRKKIDEQWKKQKNYFELYKKYEDNMMKDIDLDTYLEAQCEYNLTEKGKSESEAQQECSKKNTNSSNKNHTIFDEMLENKTKTKESVCEACQNDNENKPVDEKFCNNIQDASNCNEKTFHGLDNDGKEKKTWLCKNNNAKSDVKKDVCVPPRGQSICIANMYDDSTKLKLSNLEDDLKKKLKEAIKTETKLLWEKFGKNSHDHHKACRLTHRSLNDFKHMVIGDILWKPESINKVQEQIGKIIGQKNNKSGTATPATTEERQTWWKDNEKDFWNAVKCGIKAANTKHSGNECVRFISDDDQFEWWAKEWSDDFYEKRDTLVKGLDGACKGKDGCNGGSNTTTGECKNKCEIYKTFLQKKRDEWNKNFKKYLEEKANPKTPPSGVDQKEYSPEIFYLLNPCTYQSCDNKYITALLSTKEYGDKQKLCACDATSQKDDETNPCSDTFTEYGCTQKKFDKNIWSSTYVTHQTDRGKVFAPPRRNSMCIGWLFSPIIGGKHGTSGKTLSKDAAKNLLRDKLVYAAKGEAHYLWKHYMGGKNTGDTTKYCRALVRSYYDYGDMVKGTDLWSGGYSALVEKNIQSVFELDNDGKNGKLIKTKEELLEERKQWWDTIRGDVWKAMNCDNKNTCNGGSTPDDDKKPQFLRWIDEWGEYICEERQKQMRELSDKCKESGKDVIKDSGCANATKECKQQCNKYNRWINIYKREWLGQKSKYKEIYDNKDKSEYKDYKPHINDNEDANKYIKTKCDKCKNSGSSGANHINLDEVFSKTDGEYKKYEPFCTECRINEIVDTVKKKQKRGRSNPCANPSGITPTKTIEDIAKEMQEEAKTQLGTSSGLVGDVSKAEFKDGGTGNDLATDICTIDKNKHTNDPRKEDGPCTGKGGGKGTDTRFEVGTQWETKDQEVNSNHKGVLLSLRRRHMCTSNLENLTTNSGPLADGNNVNHSFLGDVLLTAKYEAQKIIEMYKDKNSKQDLNDAKDKETVCKAMKYSFADIGDIIRGRDIWTQNTDMQNLEDKMKKIFGKIQQNPQITGIYKEGSPYTTLRSAWWNANREQVWEAMKCGRTGINCDKDTPLDDYIPQRLRWMTEWAEWFCKAQKDEYNKVRTACTGCESGGTCTDCDKCRSKCTEYTNFITKWKADWKSMEGKYRQLYDNAKIPSSSTPGSDENQKYLDQFLNKLQILNGSNNTFENAKVYVHDIGNFDDCKEQNVFCEQNSDGKNNDKYVFRDKPYDHETKCTCTTPAKPAAVRPPAAAAAKPAATKPATTKPPSGGASHGGQDTAGAQQPTQQGGTQTPTTTPVSTTTTVTPTSTPTGTQSKTPSPAAGRSSTPSIITSSTLDGHGTIQIALNPDPYVDPSRPPGKSTSSSGEPQPQSPPQAPPSSQSQAPQEPDSSTPNQNRNIPSGKPIFRTSVDSFGNTDDPINQSRSSNKMKKSTYPMNCVEKSAYYLSKEAENALDNVKNKLQGPEKHDVYTTKQDDWSNTSSCTIIDSVTNGHIYTCDVNGNPYDEIDKWECDKKKNNVTNQDICLPPRRKHMCLTTLQNIDTSSKTTSSDELFKNVLSTAAHEGKHLKDKWEKTEQNQKSTDGTKTRSSIKRYELCDAMKYSFADIGDIIRGRDNYRGPNGNNNNIEENLKNVFEKIKTEVDSSGTTYKGDDKSTPKYKKLRDAWWDANRDKIWQAMTCTAPENAPLRKYLKDSGIDNLSYSRYKCGHDDDPPTDDYIPQVFRWISEWSENYCKVQKEKLDNLKKECGECDKDKTDLACMMKSNTKDTKCTKCINSCKVYTNMINTWYTQWTKQQEIYKQLYTSKNSVDSNERHIKAFLDKINKECQVKPGNAKEFLNETSNCTRLTFDENKKQNKIPYAFENPPDGYKVLCGTEYRKSCKALKRIGSHKICETKYGLVGEGSKWKKLIGYNIYVPPRTQQLCLKPIETLEKQKTTTSDVAEHIFSMRMQASAYNEAKLLYDYFSGDGKVSIYSNDSVVTDDDIKHLTLESMKRSYADYGDLIKGTTQYDYNGIKSKVRDIIEKLGYNDISRKTREYIWNKHKSDIWHAMICGYNDANQNNTLDEEDVMCKLPNSDTEKEYLRWFTEWTEDFCTQYMKNLKMLKDKCSFDNCDGADNNNIMECQKICSKHKTWISQKKEEYKTHKDKYNFEYKILNGKIRNPHDVLKEKCKEKCECISQNVNNDNIDNVFEEYPETFKTKCECSPDPMNKCPLNDENYTICKRFNRVSKCSTYIYENKLSEWDNQLIKDNTDENKGVLLPPRRRYLCTLPLRYIKNRKIDKNVFKKKLLDASYNQGILIGIKFKDNKDEALQAMKYSFADYGDIIKGTDMMDHILLGDLKTKLDTLLKNTGSNGQSNGREQWWEQNRTRVWNAMLCGYKKVNTVKIFDDEWCNVPSDDNTDQFLRWLTEWSQQYCKEKSTISQTLKEKCNDIINGKKKTNNIYTINNMECKNLFIDYEKWLIYRNNEWKGLSEKYIKIKNANNSGSNTLTEENAEEYVKKRCKECICNFTDMEDISKKDTPNDNTVLKELIKIIDLDTDPSRTQIQNISNKINLNPKSIKIALDIAKDILLYGFTGTMGVTTIGLESGQYLKKKIQDLYNEIIKPVEKKPDTSSNNLTFYENPNIMVPVGIGTALTIGWLLFKWRSPLRSKVHIDDMIRILEMPQNDYNIPDETSTNRYIPYGKYKGKTYIYVERDGDSEDDKYMFTSDTTDVTSSESEYEEIDLYKPRSPKYKTLIEVVLKPTKSGTTSNSGDIPSDISTNKLTDEEWNELKHDFISQYLQNVPKDLPNKNIINDDIYKNIEPNILDVHNEEKPFITSIQDRKLYSDDKDVFSYNIDWNIPNNIRTNTATYNSLYSGIDLINDSLNSGNNIYDELLKRKENELFGTKHPKNTTINSFAKKTNSDPVLNQLELFHKWLDRHRDMCNQWNNKEEMLHKLKDEWNKENNQHILDISSTHNDMNDEETYNVINTHESNDITFVDHLGSTNISLNDLQTNNLRTNIYMDIHYNENNDIINEEDQLENSYNSS